MCPNPLTFCFLFLIKIEMQADVFQGDTDEQLIVFDDDRPDDASDDDDDDPGKYGEDAMPDDFFDQFVKHKIPGTRVTNTSANKKSSSSSSSVNEGLLLPLRSVTTSEQQPQTTTTTLDREAKQQPENDSNNDKIRIERLKKDAIEATETIRAVEEALRGETWKRYIGSSSRSMFTYACSRVAVHRRLWAESLMVFGCSARWEEHVLVR